MDKKRTKHTISPDKCDKIVQKNKASFLDFFKAAPCPEIDLKIPNRNDSPREFEEPIT